MAKNTKPDLWVIAPPKIHDIILLDNGLYHLQYIVTEDQCLTVDILTVTSKSITPLIDRVKALNIQARNQIRRGWRVTNWIYRGSQL